MRWQCESSKTSCHGSPGFTLVEVLAALALLAVVGAAGTRAMAGGLRAAARYLEEARWNRTVLLFDRQVRRGIAELPAAFWAPPPRIVREPDGAVVLEERAEGGRALRFAQRDGSLEVTTPETTVRFRGVLSATMEELRASDGRVAGVRIELVGPRRRREHLVAWKGQRL